MINVLLHRVAVKPFDFNDWDEGRKRLKELGWEIPETEKDVRAQASVDVGIVEQIGPTAFSGFSDEVPIKVGDVVSYVKNAGKFVANPLTNRKEDAVVILNDEDLIAVFSKE